MRFLVSIVAVLLAIGCGRPDDTDAVATQEQPLSWDEFVAQAYLEPETGVYVVNGDEPAENLAALADSYQAYVTDFEAQQLPRGVKREALTVNTVNGMDDVWALASRNITYCVNSKDFRASEFARVVQALSEAAAAWEATANVNFEYLSAQNGNCTRTNNNVVFDVRQVKSGQYLARAFFPSTSRGGRELLIDRSALGNVAPYTLAGILRHELGHTLGFRHEHTRPESGACFENNSWRALTSYDSASVMHYPQCNGSNTGDLVLTQFDQDGARSLYPWPVGP